MLHYKKHNGRDQMVKNDTPGKNGAGKRTPKKETTVETTAQLRLQTMIDDIMKGGIEKALNTVENLYLSAGTLDISEDEAQLLPIFRMGALLAAAQLLIPEGEKPKDDPEQGQKDLVRLLHQIRNGEIKAGEQEGKAMIILIVSLCVSSLTNQLNAGTENKSDAVQPPEGKR